MLFRLKILFIAVSFLFLHVAVSAQPPVKLTLQLDRHGGVVSPRLYGLMTEEINFSYEGGLYGELIRNRVFKDSLEKVAFWNEVQDGDGKVSISLDTSMPLTPELPVSMRLEVNHSAGRAGVANEGYWGIPVKANTTYTGSLYCRQSSAAPKVLTVSLESTDGKITYTTNRINVIGKEWKLYKFTFNTGNMETSPIGRFVIKAESEGIYWFNLVSLFPPGYNNRPKGNRADLMQMMADMKPAFLRFPGGNYLEGETFANRWDWKKTIGPLEHRPGHLSPWHYRSNDGMGLLEFLQWCEDLKVEPLLGIFAGYVLKGDYLEAGPFLQPFVDDAIDEIEYITGDKSTTWGARRAADGHPEPFKLNYIEIGNEDEFDISDSYSGRYVQFYDAIKARYPDLKIISTTGGKDPYSVEASPPPSSKLEIVDEHYYYTAAQMMEQADRYDHYDRNGPKVFVGEWATREGSPTTNFGAALGDAVWMAGIERNSDLVIMTCYAPLLVNTNPGAMNWRNNLVGFNTLSCYGSPSYHMQKLFNNHIGNIIVPVQAENIPLQLQRLTRRDTVMGQSIPKQVKALFYSATLDTTNGLVFLKIINTQPTAQKITLQLKGAQKIKRANRQWILKANDPLETNSITDPVKIVPVEQPLLGIKSRFDYEAPPYSIIVMEITASPFK
jgi:alpha-N-arabinofuranosidase